MLCNVVRLVPMTLGCMFIFYYHQYSSQLLRYKEVVKTVFEFAQRQRPMLDNNLEPLGCWKFRL